MNDIYALHIRFAAPHLNYRIGECSYCFIGIHYTLEEGMPPGNSATFQICLGKV